MKKRYRTICALMTLLFIPPVASAQAETAEQATEPQYGMVFNNELKPFYHGVASGDPLADRVIIWTRVSPDFPDYREQVEVKWKIATDPYMANIVTSGITNTYADRDYTVKIDATGLEAGTTYYYGFSALGRNSLIGRTKTTPEGEVDRVRLAVITGSNYQWGVFNGYANLAKRNDLDGFIHTGDYLYEYGPEYYAHPDLENRNHYPETTLLVLDDYRLRYSQYRLDPDLRRLHQQMPIIAQWDDHEFANDSWMHGAENHDPVSEGPWEDRVGAALQAYYEWMPVRMDGSDDKTIYRTISYGGLLDLFMLETRLVGRDEQLCGKGGGCVVDETELYDPERTMLGSEQRSWLINGLTGSTAQWKIIGTSVMMSQLFMTDQYGNMDSWDGYPMERETIFGTVSQLGITNFGSISGDFHTSFAANLVPLASYSQYTQTGEGAVGFEFTTPSITSANFNEQESFALPDGTVISPLGMRLPERHPITLQVEDFARQHNLHMKYMNIDQHGYMLVDFTPEKVQAEWYYTDSLLEQSDQEILGAVWSVEDNTTALREETDPTDPGVESLPAPETPPASSIRLTLAGTWESNIFDNGAAEIVAHDPASQKLFVTNSDTNSITVLDISSPENISKTREIDLSPYGAAPNSVAVKNSIVAVAVEADNKQAPGQVVFFSNNGDFLKTVTVGSLPDMVTFTPDGRKVLVANEGEPDDDYLIDPEGSISIIDISRGIAMATVHTAGFSNFNNRLEELLAAGVRIYGPGASVAQDLEPEYITVSANSKTAWITLQENNAIAELDLHSMEIIDIYPLGYKDHSLTGNGLDGSDKDGKINIRTWDNLFGMYQPDALASFMVNGRQYLITGNEGDARDYDALEEDKRIGKLILDPEAFPNADEIQDKKELGRLQVTTLRGDIDGDGDYDRLYSFGGRSFSIYEHNDAGLQLVYDSGDKLEQITAAVFPEHFNSNDDDNDSFEKRSDNKGPEPEGVAHGMIKGRHFAFIGLERIGGIMVFDVTRPDNPVFIQYINNRDFSGDPESSTAADLSPEGLIFISAPESPTGQPMLAVANEVSGTVSLFAIDGSNLPEPISGDLNGDGEINREDMIVMRTHLRQPASVLPLADLDGDGQITIRDARKLVVMMRK